VRQFPEEFDVAKHDDEIINTLKESDEMDFVELVESKNVDTKEVASEAIKYC